MYCISAIQCHPCIFLDFSMPVLASGVFLTQVGRKGRVLSCWKLKQNYKSQPSSATELSLTHCWYNNVQNRGKIYRWNWTMAQACRRWNGAGKTGTEFTHTSTSRVGVLCPRVLCWVQGDWLIWLARTYVSSSDVSRAKAASGALELSMRISFSLTVPATARRRRWFDRQHRMNCNTEPRTSEKPGTNAR